MKKYVITSVAIIGFAKGLQQWMRKIIRCSGLVFALVALLQFIGAISGWVKFIGELVRESRRTPDQR